MTFLQNWLAYLNGYLVLNLNGERCEDFINLALEQEISLWDMKRLGKDGMQLKLPLAEFRALPSLARKSRCRVRIVDKRGWPFFYRRLQGRQMLLLGGLFFLVVIYLLSSFIWLVEVKAQNGPLRQVQPAAIIAAAREAGLKPGVYKHKLDLRALEFVLENRLPQLAWVGISLHGTRATINVVEKVQSPGEEDFERPASIIAAKDGVIKEILVISGEKRVEVGDTVRAGEVLISGLIMSQLPEPELGQTGVSPSPEVQARLVRARGIVRARVWYEKVQEFSCRQVRELPTGQKMTAVLLHTPDRSFILKGPSRPPYKNYQQERQIFALPSWRNFTFPVELELVTYTEIQLWQQQLGYEEAVKIAANQALLELKARLPAGVSISGQKITPLSEPGAETARVRVWLEVEEDIDKVVPLNGTG